MAQVKTESAGDAFNGLASKKSADFEKWSATPPMQSLRVFEACARHQSFVRASEELNLTPSAITHHIRIIERWAGSPLFRRTGRNVQLTSRARAALGSFREGFSHIAAGARILKEHDRRNRAVAISTPPSFASKWLLPRLDRFRTLHPEIEIWVSADIAVIDFTASDMDLAVRYGSGNYEGLIAEKLLPESVVPVASPSLIAQLGPFLSPNDILRAPLLHDDSADNDPSCPDWTMWMRARGLQAVLNNRGARYNLTSLVLEEAIAGKGVALAKRVIAETDLESGRLTTLFDDSTPLASAYWLVWPRGRKLEPPVEIFISWIRREIQTHDAASVF